MVLGCTVICNVLNFGRYFLERSRYYDAEVKIQAALGVHGLARAKSSLHLASTHRVHAAIAFERGKSDEAVQHVNLQMEQLELRWTVQGEALKESGLLDRAPDASPLCPWGFGIPPDKFVVLPFRSVVSFGWKLYLNTPTDKGQKYLQYLHQASLCFSTVLKDLTDAVNDNEQKHTQ